MPAAATRTEIDLASWPGADQYRFFRTFERPHYNLTARVDVSNLMAQKDRLPVYRSCMWAIGCGLNAVPELRMRFAGDALYAFDRVDLSATVAIPNGDFRFGFFDWQQDRAGFDAAAQAEIARVSADPAHDISQNRLNLCYLSCLPWLDYTSIDNALPQADDCIPRVSWGKIVPKGDGYDMAMTLLAHHAMVHGFHASQFFAATQAALDAL